MFTGIIEEVGTVAAVEAGAKGRRLRIEAKKVMEDIEPGASIAHNGVCLTVTRVEDDGYWVEAISETEQRSTLGGLWVGDKVNLERPLRLSDRLGGHLVQGHVDGVGRVVRLARDGDSMRIGIQPPRDLLRYIVEKGSIAVDGVSLTVTAVDDTTFEVAIIPHTADVTTLRFPRDKKGLNLEVDMMAKYVEKMVQR